MHQKSTSSESGQVLVILVLAIVGLLAFAALAIDGGLIYADRRGAQNAADASVLAGGYRVANTLDDFNMGFSINYFNWNCTNIQPIITDFAEPEAVSQAAKNNYPIEGDSSITFFCETGEDFGSYKDKFVETRTEIFSDVTTAFLHFAFDGATRNTVDAISRVRPRMPLAFGYAVYAHRKSCPNNATGGIQVEGSPTAVISGGGMISGACVSFIGSSNTTVTGGHPINYITTKSGTASVSPTPTPQTNTLPEWALLFPTVDCSNLPNASSNGDGTISPGVYASGIQITGNEQLLMNPGLYCFDNDFNINGNNSSFVKINGSGGVTIYMRQGNFTSNGNATVQLQAPNYVVTANDGLKGVLIYMGPSNTGEVSLLGNSDSWYNGTIYGEHEDSTIKIGGTAGATSIFNTQLIAGTVRIHGNAALNINFDSGLVYLLPSRLTLEK